ncbi:MAG: LTA synthase family protein [Clostridiaceae bacterium]|nr:LTA synthase family protein [Clostridiaceae bacterium]
MLETQKKFILKLKKDSGPEMISNLFKDKLYHIMVLIISIKSYIFIGLLGTEKATGLNFEQAFMSVPGYLLLISFSMVTLAGTFLFKGRKHLWALIVIDLLITVLIIGDAWYYRGYTEFLNFFLFSQTSNLDNLGSDVLSMSRPIDIVFIIDIVLFIIYASVNRDVYKGVKRNFGLFLLTIILPVCYLGYASYKVDVYGRGFDGQHVFYRSWAPPRTMSYLGPIGYHFFDAFNFYEVSKKYKLSKDEELKINNWYDKNNEKLPDNKFAGMFKNKNLLVIQWESLENFVVNQKIQDQEITPNLNKLLKNSLYFNNYHENTNNGTSSDADLMTNTGVYPVRQGSTFFRYPSNEYKNSLPLLLSGMGYSTYAIHPDKGLYWNWKPALTSMGFQHCLDSSNYNITETIGLGISDKVFMEQIAPIIGKEKNPFYSFVVTLTSHSPFNLPEKHRTLNLTHGFDYNMLGDYFQSLHYTDEALGKLLADLDKQGVLKDTVVAIYGDHTGVHKYYSDIVSSIYPAENWWSDNDLRVPLIIYNQNLTPQTLDIQAGQIDFMPTIAYLMGVDKGKYQNSTLGKVLVNTNKNYTILNDFSTRGNISADEEKHSKDGILLADKMVQSNYFKDK